MGEMHGKVTGIKLDKTMALIVLAISILFGPLSTAIAGVLSKEHLVPGIIIAILQYILIWFFFIGYFWGIYVAFKIYQNSA